jgi:16S rRNA processing protein RimM
MTPACQLIGSAEPAKRVVGPSTAAELDADRIVIGRVSGAFKLGGQLRIRCFGDPVDFIDVTSLMLAEREEDPGAGRVFEVANLSVGRKGELRATLIGVDDRDAAEALRGQWVFASAGELAPTDDGEYYGYELIGCTVDEEGGGKVGVVRDIWSAGGQDLLVVAGDNGAEHLVPMARSILRVVDIEARRIEIERIPGLLGDG